MIITCPQCDTQYYLGRQELAPQGRQLKCSKCKVVWFQEYVTPPKVKFNKLDVKSLNFEKDRIFLPAVIKKKNPLLGVALVAPLLCLVLALSLLFCQDGIIKKSSKLSALYDEVGLPSINGVMIHSVEVTNRTGEQMDINGIIENNSGIYKRVPPIIIYLFDENNRLLKSILVSAPPRYLNKNARYSFYKKLAGDFKTKPKTLSVALASAPEVLFHSLNFR